MSRSKSNQHSSTNFTELEAHLAGTLKPVAPPRHLIQHLRTRIHMPDPRLFAERIASWRSFFIAVGGTMSVLLLIVTVARALFHMAARKT